MYIAPLFMMATLALVTVAHAQERAGAAIYRRLVATYPFAKPYVSGYLTSRARVDWYVPRTEWNRLTSSQRAAVVRYMPELVARAVRDPAQYLELPSTAPVYPAAVASVRAMDKGQWAIGVGTLTGRGTDRTITLDAMIVCGATAPECSGEPESALLSRSDQRRAKPVESLSEPTRRVADAEASYIAGLFRDGVFYDVQRSGDGIDLLVGPMFYLLSIDEKRRATQAAWNRTFKGRDEWGVLFLKDSRTGKAIGRYTHLKGLTLY